MLLLELMQARTLCRLDAVLHFKKKKKNMLCAYLRLNKVIFCGYFTAKRGQCVFLSLSDCLSQTDDGYNTMVCV